MDESRQDIAEILRINRFAGPLPLHPGRVFPLHESDAEIVPLEDGRFLAATLDVLSEEMEVGFYREPETMGWILVQANLSDLAAVGAEPVGLLLGINLGPEWTDEALGRLAEGISQAARSQGVFVLGGDLNDARATSLGACALGVVTPPLVSRKGIRPGDRIYVTGPLGIGNALAAAQLMGRPDLLAEAQYRPRARLEAGRTLKGLVHAMMDTSDGLLATLDQLASINGVHIEVELDPPRQISPLALAVTTGFGLASWPLLFAEHGEYELVFAMAPDDTRSLPAGCVHLGEAKPGTGVSLRRQGAETIPVDCARVRNLRARTGGNPLAYIQALLGYGAEVGLG